MKKLPISTLIILFVGFQFGRAQDGCSKYYPMVKGATFQYTMYNKKGKTQGVTDYTITNVGSDGGATTATFDMKYTDDKGKELFNSDYNISCSENGIKIDYKSLFPNAMMKQYEDMGMEMEISGTDIELPNDLSVGQPLADANVSMSMKMTGMNMKIVIDMVHRKVEKKESVTTSAGTFDCYLITETNKSTVMGVNQEMSDKLWLAEGVGMVKQETYKKNGNLISRMELTKFSE